VARILRGSCCSSFFSFFFFKLRQNKYAAHLLRRKGIRFTFLSQDVEKPTKPPTTHKAHNTHTTHKHTHHSCGGGAVGWGWFVFYCIDGGIAKLGGNAFELGFVGGEPRKGFSFLFNSTAWYENKLNERGRVVFFLLKWGGGDLAPLLV